MTRRPILSILTLLLIAVSRMAVAQTPPQDPARWLGTPIVAVEIRVEGKPDTSPGLAALVDIQPGELLSPDSWRRVVQKLDQIPR